MNFGAINIVSGDYVMPINALKSEKYKCPDSECGELVMLRKGLVNRPHFAHYADSKCLYYTPHPSESQIHIDAKQKIRTLLLGSDLEIYQKCSCCKDELQIEVDLSNISSVKLEWRFKINIATGLLDDAGELKIADVACFDSEDNLLLIVEIKNTHSQCNRPNPWVELNAIDIVTGNDDNSFRCVRPFTCTECEEKRRYCLKCKKLTGTGYKYCYSCYTNQKGSGKCKYCTRALDEAWKTSCGKCWYKYEKNARSNYCSIFE